MNKSTHKRAALPRPKFERDLIRERTRAGLQAARARGRNGGRPKALSSKKQAQLQVLAADKRNSIADILDTLNLSKTTYYRYLHQLSGDQTAESP